MTERKRSLQDRILERQQSGFVGRRGELIQYRENLKLPLEDKRRWFLLNIHGNAGVGKTFLTRQLRQIATDAGAMTAYIDETVEDAASAMSAIAGELSRVGGELGEFEKRTKEYWQRRHELESDPQAPAGIAAFLTKTAVTIGLAAARDIPVAGSLLAPVDAAAVADQANHAREYIARKLRDHRDMRLLLSPANELTPVFVAGLSRAAEKQPVALFIDTYERTGQLLDQWLRSLYAGRYGDLPETLIITISGQKPLDPNLWGEYLKVIADVPLEPFSEAEARQFLASEGITDKTTIQVILTLSGRLPLWLATLADARLQGSAEIGDPSGSAVERFLKWEDDPTRRKIAIAAALPRRLNQDVLAVIMPGDKTRELFGWLRELPFVTQQGDSWLYHDVVRAAMLRWRRAEAPAEWRSEQNLLAQAHAGWANEAASGKDAAWSNPAWVDHTREEIYHLLCADPRGNLPRALASAVKAGEQSLIRASQWATLITDAGFDTSDPQLRDWGKRLAGGIEGDSLVSYFTCLINDAQLDKTILVVAHKQRGEIYRILGRFDEALADFNQAIDLGPGDTWAIACRGETYRMLGRFDEALADFNQAIDLDPSAVFAIASRGETYRMIGRYDEALADFNQAIDLGPGDIRIIACRGETYRMLGRFDEALADFNQAIDLGPGYIWIIACRGETYRMLGRYDEALADLNQAIDLDPSYALAIASRGATYRMMGRYDEAMADLNQAIELKPSDAFSIARRGETYRMLGRYDEALADLNQAIDLDPSYAFAIASRGATFRMLGRFGEALADLNQANELRPSDAWAVASRGETYRMMGRFDEALADLSKANELKPSHTWIIARRGETYRMLGRYDEAMADLNQANDLDPGDAWAVASRGETYRMLGRYDEALADLNQAIDLDPSYIWIIARRGETYRMLDRHDEALADLNRAIKLEPNDAVSIARRGATYRMLGRYDEALADLNQAIDLDPSYAFAIASRGATYRMLGRYDEAMADLNQAIELNATDVEFRAQHARAATPDVS